MTLPAQLSKGRKPNRTPQCRHTLCPSGYLEWHAWAEKKAETHDQERCPHCGLWAIWRKKARTNAP